MNGAGPMQGYGYDAGRPPPAAGPDTMVPSGKTLVEGYRTDILGGFGTQQPRFNPLNTERTQSSALVDLNDPIQVHLLTETALSDSKEYEILSQEEVDSLKKQVASLAQRIEQARSNLAVQSKYLDAATSMAKLYSTKKKALLGNVRNSVESSAREAETERLACERRCEELASELFQLERRVMEPQRRLFQHTAGILQLTHRASKNPAAAAADGAQQNGIPGSPESLYTYNNLRYSMADALPTEEDAFFDDRSLYLTLEQLDEKSGRPTARAPPPNAISIPLKSPIREQTNQLREETERLRTERDQLRAMADSVQLEMDALQRESREKLMMVSDTERKLESLNSQLRNIIVGFDPARNGEYQQPPSGRLEPGDMIGSHMDYLSRGIAEVQQEQRAKASQLSAGSRDAEMAASQAAATLAQAGGRLEALNQQLSEVLRSANPGQQPPPAASGSEFDGQLSWLQGSIALVEVELSLAASASSSLSEDKQKMAQMESVLRNMWDVIQNGYADIRRRREDRRRTRREAGLEDDEDDASGDDAPVDPNEQFSLQSFSTKVQWLYAQATNLREQKSVLKRQIKQQRELNSKSDAQKDADLQSRIDELQQTRAMLHSSEKEAKDAQQRLAEALKDLEELKQQEVASMANVSASTKAAEAQVKEREAQVKERDDQIAAVQDELKQRNAQVEASQSQLKEVEAQVAASQAQAAASQAQLQERSTQAAAAKEELKQRDLQVDALQAVSRDLQEKLTKVEDEIGTISAQLKEATEAKATAEARAAELEKEAKGKDDELDRMSVMVAELKTEATIAKAELEGAYGSRSQRAAEVAALNNSAESTELRQQIEKLKAELASTLGEFEAMTKDTITAERERVEIEGKLDDALAARQSLEAEADRLREKLEAEVGRLQDQLDAERLKAGPARSGESTPRAGASMLSEQFRATMKEERKKFQEELRNEQALRRKIEDELRQLKRAQGPGKSPLSPR